MKLTDQDIEAIAQRIAGDLRGPSAAAPAKSAAPAPAGPSQEELLAQIRDLLADRASRV